MSRRQFLRRSSAGAVVLAAGSLPADALAPLPLRQVRALRDAVRGRVLTPGAAGYDAARVLFNRRFDGVRPPAVVQVRNTGDVQAVVRWAERFDVPLTVRSGEDLYWALRGGGGSFAIVTAVRLRTRRVRRAAFFRVSFPAGSREEALAAWDALAPGAPDELTAILTLTGTGATAFGQHLGSEPALRRIVAPLGRVPGAALSAGTSGYLELQKRWAGCADGGLPACRRYERSTFDASSVYVARRLPARGRRAFVEAADTGATLILDAYGGAIGRVESGETAFVHRDVRFSVQILSYAALPTARARVRRARRLIAPYGNGQAYQNYADPRLRGARRAYYGRNYERLVRIKTEIDPADRFRVAQGIRPAGSGAAHASPASIPARSGFAPNSAPQVCER